MGLDGLPRCFWWGSPGYLSIPPGLGRCPWCPAWCAQAGGSADGGRGPGARTQTRHTRPAQLQTRGQSANTWPRSEKGGQPLGDIYTDVCHHWKCVCCLIRMFGACPSQLLSRSDCLNCKKRSIARQSQLINYLSRLLSSSLVFIVNPIYICSSLLFVLRQTDALNC